MAHLIESMFYTREEPWHGLGTRIPEEVTSAEAIKLAGLDWEVELRPTAYQDAFGRYVEVPGKSTVVRRTDARTYNVVGPQYTPIQNAQAFEFFDAVVATGEACYHTAGSIASGAKVWILAKLKDQAEIKGVDLMDNYLLLVNGHDGTLSFQMLWTPIRVVCNNTMVRALSRANGAVFTTRHSAGIKSRIDEARRTLGFTTAKFTDFIAQAEALASHSFLKAEMDDFLKTVLEIMPDATVNGQPRKVAALNRIEELVETGAGLQHAAIRGSKWALYNAVTEWVDHERIQNRDRALNSAWFGTGADLKARAWSLLQN